MPIRYIVERHQWEAAERIFNPPDTAQPHVLAIAVWAREMGLARTGHSQDADKEAETLRHIEGQLRASGNQYWATQVDIMRREVAAWSAQAMHQSERAAAALRSAADDEDGIEKLPLTPGPIVPAREAFKMSYTRPNCSCCCGHGGTSNRRPGLGGIDAINHPDVDHGARGNHQVLRRFRGR